MANKTEKATPRRRKQQREEGQIAKSKELGIFWTLLAFAIVLIGFSKYIAVSMTNFMLMAFELAKSQVEPKVFFVILTKELFKILIPIFLIGFTFQLINHFIQVKFLFSLKIIKPKFSRMSLFQYFKNLFSRKKVVDIVKGFIILFSLGYVAYIVITINLDKMLSSYHSSWEVILLTMAEIFAAVFIVLLIVFGIISLIDFAYERWEQEQKMKMTREEVKREMKDTEGNPEMKSRRKNLMYELVKKDVTNKVPDATFVVTNPTHFAVAVKYTYGEMAAPVILAKGEDQLALYIKSLAKQHKIPTVENKPLARGLYFNVEVGEEIPPEMYDAVLRVLDYLSKTKRIQI